MKDLNQNFSLKKVYINTNSIVAVEQDEQKMKSFQENPEFFPEGLDKRSIFSSVCFQGGAITNYITVVGSPESITSKV